MMYTYLNFGDNFLSRQITVHLISYSNTINHSRVSISNSQMNAQNISDFFSPK